jgi:hypothetical protein
MPNQAERDTLLGVAGGIAATLAGNAALRAGINATAQYVEQRLNDAFNHKNARRILFRNLARMPKDKTKNFRARLAEAQEENREWEILHLFGTMLGDQNDDWKPEIEYLDGCSDEEWTQLLNILRDDGRAQWLKTTAGRIKEKGGIVTKQDIADFRDVLSRSFGKISQLTAKATQVVDAAAGRSAPVIGGLATILEAAAELLEKGGRS